MPADAPAPGGRGLSPAPIWDAAELQRVLERIDGRGYGAYRELDGARIALDDLTIVVEKVQSDPYAPPTRLAVEVPAEVAALPSGLWSSPPRRRGLEDHLGRLVAGRAQAPFRVAAGGQEVLDRTTVAVTERGVRLRLAIALPDRRRRVRGREVAGHLLDELPAVVRGTLRWSALDGDAAQVAVDTVEDASVAREQLTELGLVAFVADGATLPRRSGIDDRPLRGAEVVAFASPPSLRRQLELPHRGQVEGMGVPAGVTLIVGGGFHGKSTLLRALERGVYDHVPGDGRELVVTRDDAVTIRAEDGRRVERVDVSAFVGALPTSTGGAAAEAPRGSGGPHHDTRDFSTDNASGSTSQAANIVEALEAGAGTLLIDEDTAATNLMIRDLRMQELVSSDREPLTPFVDLVRPLHREHGVSSVLVLGGSGDYFDVADHVIAMDAFVPRDVTERAREVAARFPGRRPEATAFPAVRHRVPDPTSVDPRRRGRVRTRARGRDELGFGDEHIDLSAVPQVVDPHQTAAIGLALVRLVDDEVIDGARTLATALDGLDERLSGSGGLEWLRGGFPGDLARPRRFEVAAALNRLRSLRISRVGEA